MKTCLYWSVVLLQNVKNQKALKTKPVIIYVAAKPGLSHLPDISDLHLLQPLLISRGVNLHARCCKNINAIDYEMSQNPRGVICKM